MGCCQTSQHQPELVPDLQPIDSNLNEKVVNLETQLNESENQLLQLNELVIELSLQVTKLHEATQEHLKRKLQIQQQEQEQEQLLIEEQLIDPQCSDQDKQDIQ